MKKNMGTADRIIRLVIAALLVILWVAGITTGTLGYVSIALAAVFTLTAAIGFCPLYAPFGIKTCKS